jgi:FAD binding domain
MPADPFIQEDVNFRWVNHHFNVKANVAKRLTIFNENPGQPKMSGMRKTAARIQQIINNALAAGVRLRACGSRWSFSDIPVVADGWILETQNIDWRFRVSPNDMEAGSGIHHDELILAQTGASIHQLNAAVEVPEWGRALRTSGASNGQTVGGALGTGIHGSALSVGGLESQVAGIQLITADRILWIERASRPVLNTNFAITKLGATELIRNDAMFEAAIVSLGALGIVHAVALFTTGRYRLNSSMSHIPLPQIQRAMNTLNFVGSGIPDESRQPYFFQTIIDPRRADIAYTEIRYKELCPPNYVPNYDQVSGREPGTDLARIIGGAIQMFPDLRDTAVSILMTLKLKPRIDSPAQWGTPGETYTHTSAREGIASCGFAIPIAQVSRAIEIARLGFMANSSAPVVFTCRYAQKSPGILSFTRYDPTCIMDIDGIDTPVTHALIRDVCDLFDAEGMPYTMHWGKTNHMTAQRVRNAFGGAVDRWNTMREILLPNAAERDLFSSPFLDSIGLNG